jgi:hypothetical protein
MIYSCIHALRKMTAYIETKRYLTPNNYLYGMIKTKEFDLLKILYFMTITIDICIKPIMNDLRNIGVFFFGLRKIQLTIFHVR